MPASNDQSVFPDYIRVRDVDQSRLADLTLQAKGDRSLSDFARLCGVNPSTLSRLVNQKNNGPCSDSLIKAIAENADPDSGITLEMLLDAQGLVPYTVTASRVPEGASSLIMQFQKAVENLPDSSAIDAAREALKKYTESADAIKMANQAQSELQMCQKKLSLYREEIDNYRRRITTYNEQLHRLTQELSVAEKKATCKQTVANDASDSTGVTRRVSDRGREREFEKDSREIVINALVNAGYSVKLEKPVGEMSPYRHFDFGISTDALEERNIKSWYFDVRQGIYSVGMRFLDSLFRDLYFDSTYDEGAAVSLVISDQASFERIKRYYDGKEIHDYVSVILVDRSKREIVDEFIFVQRGKEPYRSIFEK